MSELDRAVHALLVPGFLGTTAPDWLRRRLDDGLGGVALFARNIGSAEQLRALTDGLHGANPDVLVAVDEEGGDVTRLEAAHGSRHPGALALGQVDDVDLTRRVASSIGALLVEARVDWTWSPVADVSSNAANPIVGVRAFGSDPDLVARHVTATVAGLQDDAGIIACAKHFPGHGDTDLDSHLELPTVARQRSVLDTVDLVPFRAAIAAGVRTVMTGHLRILAVDPDVPATLSRPVVTGLLRHELGFTGVVVSDALEMEGVARGRGIGEAAVTAVLAGVDVLCLGGQHAGDEVVATVHAALVAAVRDGRLPEDRVAHAGARVAALAGARSLPHDPLAPMSFADGVLAAARAIMVDGRPELGPGAPLVVRCDPAATLAAGARPWGIVAPLAAVRPGVTEVLLGPEDDLPPDLPLDRPVALVLRDAGRHAWQRAVESRLLATHPGSVVVEMGVPVALPRAAAGRITTYGASAASAQAAVDLLTAREGRRTR